MEKWVYYGQYPVINTELLVLIAGAEYKQDEGYNDEEQKSNTLTQWYSLQMHGSKKLTMAENSFAVDIGLCLL